MTRSKLTSDVHKLKKRLISYLIVFHGIETLKYEFLDSNIVLIQKIFHGFTELVEFLFRNEVVEKFAELLNHDVAQLLMIAIS